MTSPDGKPTSSFSSSSTHHHHHYRHRRRNTCLCFAAAVVLAFILILVLALTVFRPKQSVTTVTSIRLQGLKVGFGGVSGLGLGINATVLLGLSVYNPNKAGFAYGNGTAQVYYRGGLLVGEAAIPPGEIGAGGTEETEARLVVMADRLVGANGFYGDVMAGSLPMTTQTTIRGKAKVLGIRHAMTMYTTCDIVINTFTRGISKSDCRSRTKL